MKRLKVVTIDGPSASGKGALSRSIANRFDFDILDSGLLYRLYAYLANKKINIDDIKEKILKDVSFIPKENGIVAIFEGGEITNQLRTEEIAKLASAYSSKKEVRKSLFDIQRNFYDERGLVADGRDMGTVVFRDAKLKIFLTASSEIRAKRRFLELQNRGQEVNMPALIADIEKRDLKDSSRELSPLLPAEDAHIIDSSEMSLEDVFSFTENLIKEEFL
jgi:cytidylate kinase